MTLVERLLDLAAASAWPSAAPRLALLPPALRERLLARRLARGPLLASQDVRLLPRRVALSALALECDVPVERVERRAADGEEEEEEEEEEEDRWPSLAALRLSGEYWAAWLRHLSASARLRAVSLPSVSPREAGHLAALLRGVAHVDLARAVVLPDDVARLVRALAASLRSLSVSGLRPGGREALGAAMASVDGQLRRLYVTGSRLADEDLAWIRAAGSRLETLSLRFNPQLTSEALCSLVRNDLPSVRELSIGLMDDVDDSVADALADAPMRLRALDISRSSVSDDGLARLVRVQYRLARLNVTSCDRIGAAGVRAVASSLRDLRVLVLNFTDVDDDALAHVAVSCRKLAVLRVSACHLVTDDGVGALRPLAGSLRALSLGGGRISDDVLPHIACLEALESLSLWSTAVSPHGVARLAAVLDVAPPADADGAVHLGREPSMVEAEVDDADHACARFIFDEIV